MPSPSEADPLRQRLRQLEGRLEDALREKATAELQIDRTERSLLASYRDLAQKNEALTEKNRQLEQALHAEATARTLAEEREKLLRQIVHDQRTDLMNIALAVDIARRQPGSDSPFEAIRQSVERIEQFLTEKIARLVDHGAPPSATALIPAVEAVANLMGGSLATRQQTLALTIPEIAVTVPLSAIEFEQVAINLLTNASKFSPAGSTICVSLTVQPSTAILRVSDEGPGIPVALMTAIGDGVRADQKVPGSGLGLRNVKALLARIGGDLRWQNGERGAVFEAVMPLSI